MLSRMILTAETRNKFGKSVHALRREGLVPAELYGHGAQNAHLMVNGKELHKALKSGGESQLIELAVGKDKKSVMIHDVQRDYLSHEVIHVDFYVVRMDEKVHAKVPVVFLGEAPAVKGQGGLLNKSLTEIEIEALPGDLPHSISADLSVLVEFHASIYVKDLPVPRGVKILVDPGTVVATVMPPAKAEEVPVAPIDVGAVKVESEEKKVEREAEKAKKDDTKETKAA